MTLYLIKIDKTWIKLLYTKQSFFDITPMGNIITRISKDQQDLETYIPLLMDNQLIAIFTVVYIIGLIAVSMPYILLAFAIGIVPERIFLQN